MAANWSDILSETTKESTFDRSRRKYLAALHEKTGRNIITYYSGWMQKPQFMQNPAIDAGINDNDKGGFMATINQLDRTRGLDLLLHTPGGNMAATESLVEYLRQMFEHDIRAFIPQLAMSAGTMIACACSTIYMGAHSSIGPIDPQFNNMPANGIVEEFEKAAEEIKNDQSRILVWAPILQKINPTMLSEAIKASEWAKEMVQEWLETGMLNGQRNKKQKAAAIVAGLTDAATNKSHSRHIGIERARQIGLKIIRLEDDQELQDAVLGVHHSCIITLTSTPAFKIIENHLGVAFIQQVQQGISLPLQMG